MFDFFKKKTPSILENPEDNSLYAMATGKEILLEKVNDPVFAEKLMGDGSAFVFDGDEVVIHSPANAQLKMLAETGHAFGLVLPNGTEILVHIGIDTVEAKGHGFTVLSKQGQAIKAGDPVVKVNQKQLRLTYDLTTMLIVTKPNGNIYPLYHERNIKVGELLTKTN